MRGEVPEGVHVLAHAAQVQPLAVDVVDFADFSPVDELLHLPHGGVVEEDVPDHEDATAVLGQADQHAALSARLR